MERGMPHSSVMRSRNGNLKHDAILKAASRLFLKLGYTRTSMDAVAVEANVSKQTVYTYFKNKDELFCRMIEEACLKHTPSYDALVDPSLSLQDALNKIGHGFINMISSSRGLAIHRLVMAEVDRHPRIAKLFFDSGPLRMQALLVHYLNHQIELGHFVIDDVDSVASNFFAMIKGRYHLRMQLKVKPLPTAKEIDSHIASTIALFCRMYSA